MNIISIRVITLFELYKVVLLVCMPSLPVKEILLCVWMNYITSVDLTCFTHYWWCQGYLAGKKL